MKLDEERNRARGLRGYDAARGLQSMAQVLVAPSIVSEDTAEPSALSWPSPTRAWYAVAIFGATVFTLFGNQFLVALMIEPIRLDTRLSDNQVALIFGGASGFVLAFASLVVS